jgi:choline dehydrogenase-like flavoprotein
MNSSKTSLSNSANPNPNSETIDFIEQSDRPGHVEGARAIAMPTFDSNNGRLMEAGGGVSILDLRVRDGKRLSVFRTYAFPYMDRPNLTVLTHAVVTRLTLEGKRATGVEIAYDGKIQSINAGLEVVLSLGAIQTPKVLMLSGVGDQAELQRLGIPVFQHLPGVGQTFGIILVLAVSGSISNRSFLATTEVRRRSSGRAILILTLRICRHARVNYRSAVPRQPPCSIHRRLLGPCLEVSCDRKVEVRSA